MLAVFAALGSVALRQTGMATEPPPGFAAVPQLGAEGTGAIEIAPDRKWFLTGTQVAIAVRDLGSGDILRELEPAGVGYFTRMAISADGRFIFAELLPDTSGELQIVGWTAETGSLVENAVTLAPSLDAGNWLWIGGKWPASWPYPASGPFTIADEKKYLVDQHIDSLVNLEKVEEVEGTSRGGIIEVTTSDEARDKAEEDYWAYHVYFIDVVRKQIVADVSGKTLRTFCGRPHGAFAFDGQHLLLAPTERDASASNVNALLVDTQSVPPVLKWSRPCQDTQVSGMDFRRGLIVVSATPDQVTLWDPGTGRRIIHFDDIHDSDVLTWSSDLTTFATGFHEWRTIADHTYGAVVIRSGKKRFFRTDGAVLEIRLGNDGSKVFVRTGSGWSAWNASSGGRLSSSAVPAASVDYPVTRPGPSKSPDGKFEIVRDRLIETATGRVLVDGHRFLRFSEDFRYVSESGPGSMLRVKLWETASGHLRWQATATGSIGLDALIMQYADGRVLVSRDAEYLVKFVRGFEVRPFRRARHR